MANFVLITDSSADLDRELIAELDLRVLPLEILMEGCSPVYNDQVDVKDFYAKLRAKSSVTTSAVSIDRFTQYMEPFLKEGNDVLYLGFSSELSGTYNAGLVAANELAEKYPERTIKTVDTLCASTGQGLLVYLAAKKRLEGASLEEVRQFAEETKLHICHWFTVDDLFFLKRGGRVSSATAVMGTMLSIKPVMHVDNKGKLINVAKARGRKAAMDTLIEKMKATVIEPEKQTCFICHGDCLADAEYVADRMKKDVGVPEVIIEYTGPVIGAHSGPGTLAIFYVGTER
ncbi:MAG: DegV family protein [Clostridia bacterium]|nr:DegV family protein [Clostridia bacterium]